MLDTVATDGLDDAHGVVGCDVPAPVKLDVNPRQAFIVPVMVGNTKTVKVPVTIQPLLFI